MHKTHTLALTALLLAAAPLAAQNDGQNQAQTQARPGQAADQQPETLEQFEMAWSDPAFAEIADMLTGSWKTVEPVAQFRDQSQSAEVIMSIGPAPMDTLPDALYIETARADAPDQPYRTAFLQLYRRQGEIRMRTLEIRDPNSPVNNMLVGMWTVPQFIPDVPRDALIATLDLEFEKTRDGWVAETPYPYPTAVGGAVEMTSRTTLTPGRIETADRGYDASGNVVWGADEGDAYVFEPTESPFAVDRHELGLITITLRDLATAPPSQGDTVAFQYSGWLTTGQLFDTSRRSGARPLQYAIPGNLIEGWNLATEGMSEGDWRKFIVPSELGYGPSSAAGGRIPGGSTLIFEAELVGVSSPPGAED